MHNYITKKVLGFKDENIKILDFIEKKENITIKIELKRVDHGCPRCGSITDKVHDYRIRKFKHGNLNGYNLSIKYNRRRYVCKECNKKFPEDNNFIDSYSKISNQLNNLIIKRLTNKHTFKDIAKDTNVSSSTIIRRFDKHFSINKLELPEVISIDEFKKTNQSSKRGKYALAIADPINKKLIDILENRRKFPLNNYLEKVPIKVLNNVKVVIIDMWEPYRDLIYKHFRNANIVIDRFHYIRNIIWWLNDIRIKTMNSFKPNQKGYKLLKKFHKLLIKNPKDIHGIYSYNKWFNKMMSPKSIIDECLELNEKLKEAYKFYADFQKATSQPFDTKVEALEFIDDFVTRLYASNLDGSINLANMFINWRHEIANSLYLTYKLDNITYRYTNGFIEGVNNYIKTFRRMCYNIRNFERFITRIITTFNQDFLIKA